MSQQLPKQADTEKHESYRNREDDRPTTDISKKQWLWKLGRGVVCMKQYRAGIETTVHQPRT